MSATSHRRVKQSFLAAAISVALTACITVESDSQNALEINKATKYQPTKNIEIWPELDIAVKKDSEVEARVQSLLSKMTLEQKIAQMMQPEIRDITVEDMRRYGFGSYLNGGGSFPHSDKHATAQDWIDLAEAFYQASVDDSLDGINIPTMWGTDAVHGHNNVIGATLFPHNIGLGATHNPELIEQVAQATAIEVMATGIDWVFAPTVAVVRDDRWGRSYEGYSEDPELVREYSAAIVKGLQGHADQDFLSDARVISSVKHFIGDGGTVGGDDQGNNIASEQELFDIHAQGYVGGLTVGAQTVMASFNSWHGKKVHGYEYLLTDVLKERMGFDGFVVGDWNGHGQVAGCSKQSCPQAVNAGLDMYMVPTQAWKPLLENTIAQVKSGEISQARIDDAVSRILRVKIRAGLFEKPSPANRTYSGKTELIGAKAHRDVARQAVRESLVLLKNSDQLLPLSPNQRILVAGDGADNIGKQAGGWSITWQGTGNTNDEFPGATSIYQGIKAQVEQAGGQAQLSVDGDYQEKPDVAIVVFGEDPYAEGHGDLSNLEFERGDKKSLALLNKLKAQGIPVVSLFISGRPMWVNPELNASDAFVAVWLPGSEGQGIADVILKDASDKVQYPFTGRLTFSWPNSPYQTNVNRFDDNYSPLLPYGFGLTNGQPDRLAAKLNESFEPLEAESNDVTIFAGALKKPWQLKLVDNHNTLDVNANSMNFGAASYRTIDKVLQEDAFLLALDGSKRAGIRFQSDFREDLRGNVESDASLTFSVNLPEQVSGELYLGMLCENTGEQDLSCGYRFNIAPQLNKLALNQWHSLAVSLSCFKDHKVDFGTLISPFDISSSDKVSVKLADIVVTSEIESKTVLSCN